MTAHNALTGSDLHEPKGASTATSGQVYVADGAGSGTWTTAFNLNKGCLSHSIPDVSTTDTKYLVFPFDCTINKITTVLQGAITGTDSTIAVTKTGGASLGNIIIAVSGSAEGTIDTLTPASNNTLTADQWLKLACDGASTGAQELSLTIEYTRTSA